MAVATVDDDGRFRDRYAVSGTDAFLAVEAAALGSDYQANGYTTVAQADELGYLLELDDDQLLLDVGAGCGWPGLYLAWRHGCAVIGADPVFEGCEVARRRTITDELAARSWTVQANAVAVPLRSGSVDAVVHTDLMC